jgi:hypothetical protein
MIGFGYSQFVGPTLALRRDGIVYRMLRHGASASPTKKKAEWA